MIQNTSLEAFREVLPELGFRQSHIYRILKAIQPATNTQIASASNLPINSVTPRVFELRRMGLVVFDHTATCPITGRNAKFWRIR